MTREVVGYEDYYSVTDSGQVYSLKQNRFLKPTLGNHGYYVVGIKGDLKTVHRLVAQAFISNPMNKPEVNHKNGIKTDNRVENLEWCNRSYNTKHAIDNGLKSCVRGEEQGSSKLTERNVLEIRSKYKPYIYTQKMLAKEYGVTRTCIQAIIEKISWKHLN